jgi:ComF family protein
MIPSAREVVNGLLDLIYPPKCLVCGQLGGEPLCARCLDGFPPLPKRICRRCGAPLEDRECRHCLFQPAEHLAMARSAGTYAGALRRAIIRLKYEGRRNLALPLGRCLAEYLSRYPFGRADLDLIIPIPLHKSRMNEREFNQAALIAREVAAELSLPIVEECVERTRSTRPQVSLHASERAANVRGAFRVTCPERIAGKRILLIDDVATTLSTADSCARALSETGAHSVYLATVARDV